MKPSKVSCKLNDGFVGFQTFGLLGGRGLVGFLGCCFWGG